MACLRAPFTYWLGVSAALVIVSDAPAQGFYDDFSVAQGFVGRSAPLTSGANAAKGWITNDPLTGPVGQEVGETNYVRFVTNYTVGGSRTNYSLVFGGPAALQGFFPGQPAPELSKAFTPFSSLSGSAFARFETEFAIVGSIDPRYPVEDTFSFDLRTTAGTSLAKISFDPGPVTPPILDGYDLRIEWARGGVTQSTSNPALVGYFDAAYLQKYRLQIDVSGSQFTARVLTLLPDRTVFSTATVVNSGQLTEGFSVADLAQVAVMWELSNTLQDNASIPLAYNNAGYNYLIINDIGVQAIPEPRVFGLLLLGATLFFLKKRVTRHAVCSIPADEGNP